MADVHLDDDLMIDAGPVTARSVVNRRHDQQDALVAADGVVAVADGVGGHADGAAAARAALAALTAALDGRAGRDELLAAAGAANDAVCALADGTWRNPGSTLVAASVDPDGTAVNGVWCGDSRAYLIGADRTVTQLTSDQAFRAGGLWGCLGAHGDAASFVPETFSVPVAGAAGAKLLLTTDGAHGPLDVDELAQLVCDGGVAALVEAAAAAGTDNTTAVLVDLDGWVVEAPRSSTTPSGCGSVTR